MERSCETMTGFSGLGFIVNILVLAIPAVILYFLIKQAVKKAIIELKDNGTL